MGIPAKCTDHHATGAASDKQQRESRKCGHSQCEAVRRIGHRECWQCRASPPVRLVSDRSGGVHHVLARVSACTRYMHRIHTGKYRERDALSIRDHKRSGGPYSCELCDPRIGVKNDYN